MCCGLSGDGRPPLNRSAWASRPPGRSEVLEHAQSTQAEAAPREVMPGPS